MALFRLDEVFQMAMHAEQMGQLLYESTAKEAKDPQVVDLCQRLASQEKAHYETFKSMQEAMPKDYAARRLSLEEMAFVQSLVDGSVIPSEAEARKAARENSLAQILDTAIQAERNSQDFYGQIAQGVDAAGASAIRAIIEEEKQHEQVLSEARRRLKD